MRKQRVVHAIITLELALRAFENGEESGKVARLGGDFEVDSSPGAGTRITVTLPLRR